MAVSILITGGAGFVGSAIIDAVQEKHPQWKVSVLDLQMLSHPRNNVHYERGDITLPADIERIVHLVRPTAIIHSAGFIPELASRYNRKARNRAFSVNVEGTRNVLTIAKSAGVEVLVWTGSCTAVTDDTAAEALVLAANDEKFATCALRPSVIFGPGDGQLIPSLYSCIMKGETPYILGSGLNLWDVTYVTNVADAHVLAVENLLSSRTAAGEAIFISNEQPIPFRDFCLAVWREFGHYPPFQVHIPRSIAAFAGVVADWMSWLTGIQTTLSNGSVNDACATRYCSGTKAREVLGYVPKVGLEEGIKRSCEEYRRRCKFGEKHDILEQ